METIAATTAAEVRDAVAVAAATGRRLEVRGAGTKRSFGAPIEADAVLDIGGLAGVIDYEPSELVLTAAPGTPLAVVEQTLAAHGQHLAFEPPGAAAGATLGGVLAGNESGPRRVAAGAARDHFLGVSAVSGRGESFKSGGRVIKNVTGYDLPKLLAGSWGTLAVLTEVSVKVLPAPESTATLLLPGLDPAAANAAMTRAAGTPLEVSGLAYLPAPAAARSGAPPVAAAADSVVGLRVEGPAPSVAARIAALHSMFGDRAGDVLHDDASRMLWREIGERALLPDTPVLWRLSAPPAAAAGVIATIAAAADAEFLADWAGGRVWVALDRAEEPLVRGAAAAAGGHASLFAAPSDVRRTVPVFPPLPPALAALQQRVRHGFDPAGILNRGRMGPV